jgi:hypothetical protein
MDQLFLDYSDVLEDLDRGRLRKNLKTLTLLCHYINARQAMKEADQAYKRYVETDDYTFNKGSVLDHWTNAHRLRREKEDTYWRANSLFLDLKSL